MCKEVRGEEDPCSRTMLVMCDLLLTILCTWCVWFINSSQMKGLAISTALHMWIVPKGAKVTNLPHCHFINLELVPGSKPFVDGFKATMLLENPVGENLLSYQQLQLEVREPCEPVM